MSTSTIRSRMAEEVSAASGALFRIGFGIVGMILVFRFFVRGWIESLLVEPAYHFSYPGFEWVRVWPEPWMHVHFLVIGLAALGIALGYHYRLSAALFALSLGYVELIDRSLYLNHYYWVVLTAAVMVFLPLNTTLSLDARHGRVRTPGRYPAWVVWMLRFQVGMVYVFAGMAKLNGDWLLRAEPLSTWLPARSEMWLIGPVLTLPVVAYLLSWAGAFFDLTIVAWLSWRPARPFAYVALVVFHTLTWLIFPSIGLFPLLMSLSALVFFDPAWPNHFLPGIFSPVGGGVALGRRRGILGGGGHDFPPPRLRRYSPPREERWARGHLAPFWVGLGACYVLVMIALPLRHHLTPGDVKWTGEGYLGSWQVMLSEKSASADFIVTDPATGKTWTVPPPDYLTERQHMVMATDPLMIRQTARLIADDLGGLVEVAADVRLSFNGRTNRQFTDPEVVISNTPLTERVEGFILAQPPA
jgi:vitamin K-dependent gamma-carboxylase